MFNAVITVQLLLTPLALQGIKLYGAIGAGVLVFIILIALLTGTRKRPEFLKKILGIPFPGVWRNVLSSKFPIYGKLPDKTRRNLEKHIQVFIATKEFQGTEGLEITEEIRLLIAAQASLLICNIDDEFGCYQRLEKVVVFPDKFYKDAHTQELVDGVALPPFLDENGYVRGEIYLSWSDVQTGVADGEDGFNPVFHYFAKALDQEDFEEDGVPSTHIKDQVAWLKVWHSYFHKFQVQVQKGESTVLDHSGARSLPEFFAVATECFFEIPQNLLKESPGLYNKLKLFYQQDPAHY